MVMAKPTSVDELIKVNPAAAAVIEEIKPMLIIQLIRMMGGSARVSIDELESTGGYVLMMKMVDGGTAFEFNLVKKPTI